MPRDKQAGAELLRENEDRSAVGNELSPFFDDIKNNVGIEEYAQGVGASDAEFSAQVGRTRLLRSFTRKRPRDAARLQRPLSRTNSRSTLRNGFDPCDDPKFTNAS